MARDERSPAPLPALRVLAEAGLHPATGGDGTLACSGDMLLDALVACAGVTLSAVATALGVALDDATVTAEGDLDVRGTLGVSKEVAVGFRDIRLMFDLATDASDEQCATLLRLCQWPSGRSSWTAGETPACWKHWPLPSG